MSELIFIILEFQERRPAVDDPREDDEERLEQNCEEVQFFQNSEGMLDALQNS